jgi:hypothetical protein
VLKCGSQEKYAEVECNLVFNFYLSPMIRSSPVAKILSLFRGHAYALTTILGYGELGTLTSIN